MKVLVTGTEGYIWSIIKKQFKDLNVLEYDIKNGDDIFDTKNLQRKMQGCEVVLHLAAYPSREAVDKVGEEECMRLNHGGAMHIYNLAKEMGVKRFIYTSTGNVYCCSDYFFDKEFPLDVDDIPEPSEKVHPYPRSKILTERWLKEQSGMQVIVLRINSVEQDWIMELLKPVNRGILRMLGKPKKWNPWGNTLVTRKRLGRYFRNACTADIKEDYIILDVIEPNPNYKGSMKAEALLN